MVKINFDNSMPVIITLVVVFTHLVVASTKFETIAISETVAKTICSQRQTLSILNQILAPMKWKRPPTSSGADRTLWYHWHKICHLENGDCVSSFVFKNLNTSEACPQGSRVFGGCPVRPYEYPSLLTFGSDARLACGAVLLTSEWILTAAHCCLRGERDFTSGVGTDGYVTSSKDNEFFLANPGDYSNNAATKMPTAGRRSQSTRNKVRYWVVAAEHNKTSDDGFEQRILVESRHAHPAYNRTVGSSHDLCLVKLSQPLNLTDKVWPAKLPTKPYNDGTFRVVGWGLANDIPQQIPVVPHKVDLNVMSAEECLDVHAGLYPQDVEKMLCARILGEKKGSGIGDSGGPFYHVQDDVHTVVGITSHVLLDGQSIGWNPGYISVFIKVYSYLDWIREVMSMY